MCACVAKAGKQITSESGGCTAYQAHLKEGFFTPGLYVGAVLNLEAGQSVSGKIGRSHLSASGNENAPTRKGWASALRWVARGLGFVAAESAHWSKDKSVAATGVTWR